LIFISYNHADSDFVKKLTSAITSQGVDFWLDEKQMLAGDSITDGIEKGLSRAKIFAIVLSKNSIAAPWVREELRIAINIRIRGDMKILPLLVDDCEIPLFLLDYKYVDFSKDEHFVDAIGKLLDAILLDQDIAPLLELSAEKNIYINHLNIVANVSGPDNKFVQFTDTHEIVPLKPVSSFLKELNLDGELQNVECDFANVDHSQSSKFKHRFELDFHKKLLPGEKFVFPIKFEVINEFSMEKSFSFRMDALVRKFTCSWIFNGAPHPENMEVKQLRGIVEIENTPLRADIQNDCQIYTYEYDLPRFGDWFKFKWS